MLNLFTWKVCILKVVSLKGFILLWTKCKAVLCIPHSSALHADPTVVGNKIDSPVGDSSSAGRKELKHIKSSFALSVFWVCFSSCLMSHLASIAAIQAPTCHWKLVFTLPDCTWVVSTYSFWFVEMMCGVKKEREEVFCLSFCVLFWDIWAFAAFLMVTFPPQLEYQLGPSGRMRLRTTNCIPGCARRHWNTKRRQSRLSASEQSRPSRCGRRHESISIHFCRN